MSTLVASAKMRQRVERVSSPLRRNAAPVRLVRSLRPGPAQVVDKPAPQTNRQVRQAAIHARLCALAPALFSCQPPLPMAVGIKRELITRLGLDEGRDLAALRAVLRTATERRPYLVALASPGAERHDIAGKPVGRVSLEHQAHALRFSGSLPLGLS